jgi:hypothetical protein
MSYDIAITKMGIIARKVAEDNNWAPYRKELNPFRTQPRSVMLEFMTEYNRALIKHERERVGYY